MGKFDPFELSKGDPVPGGIRPGPGTGHTPSNIDPVCLLHGKRWSEHEHGRCLFCCLCFSELTLETCNLLPDGKREDVCHECLVEEALMWNVQYGIDKLKSLHEEGHITELELERGTYAIAHGYKPIDWIHGVAVKYGR
jgi:hypothetical protein